MSQDTMSETAVPERSNTDVDVQAGAVEVHDDHRAGSHPSDWAYVKIALVLAALTALEVFTYFESVVDWGAALVPSLIFMMIVKFYLVATWFMHLRFESKLFGRLFVAGLVLAVGVYVATLAAFEFWF